jgi:Thioesterase-like superfamily
VSCQRFEVKKLSTIFSGFCTTHDVNIAGRQTNARYLRELDFAKFFHYNLTGLYDLIADIKVQGGNAFQGASLIVHHKNIKIFKSYKIETKIVWWDENAIYLQQKFVTFDKKFSYLTVLSKQRITKVNVLNLMNEFKTGEKRPQQPEELQTWLKAMELSSQKLRKYD